MPRERSLTLTDHELRLMNVLWEKRSASVADVVAALGPPKLAYNTVLTTLRTLDEKGYVDHKKAGRAFIYSPAIERSEAATSLLGMLLDRFFGNSPGALAMAMLDGGQLSKREIAVLRAAVERKEQRK
ncbi:MAG TPA: BlaI/MecI/CopY family transcriptional regulator [Candidatus Baltobacteraceae bacterium]